MHFYKILHGGDLTENNNFKGRKLVMRGYKILYGADLKENDSFKVRKLFILSFGIEGST